MAKQLNLDLGNESSGPCCPCEVPKDRVYYPSFHYSGSKHIDVPEEGVMTIRYCKTSSTVSQNHERDKKHYSCSFDVKEILSVDAEEVEAPSKRDKSAEESLDALMEEKQKSNKKGY